MLAHSCQRVFRSWRPSRHASWRPPARPSSAACAGAYGVAQHRAREPPGRNSSCARVNSGVAFDADLCCLAVPKSLFDARGSASTWLARLGQGGARSCRRQAIRNVSIALDWGTGACANQCTDSVQLLTPRGRLPQSWIGRDVFERRRHGEVACVILCCGRPCLPPLGRQEVRPIATPQAHSALVLACAAGAAMHSTATLCTPKATRVAAMGARVCWVVFDSAAHRHVNMMVGLSVIGRSVGRPQTKQEVGADRGCAGPARPWSFGRQALRPSSGCGCCKPDSTTRQGLCSRRALRARPHRASVRIVPRVGPLRRRTLINVACGPPRRIQSPSLVRSDLQGRCRGAQRVE